MSMQATMISVALVLLLFNQLLLRLCARSRISLLSDPQVMETEGKLLTLCDSLCISQNATEHSDVYHCFEVSALYSDFDVHLYLCNAAFSYLDFATFVRLSHRLLFPIYALAHCGLLVLLVVKILQSWCR